MKRYNNVQSWVGHRGTHSFRIPAGQAIGFVISDGCSVRFCDEERVFVLASGRGVLDINHRTPGGVIEIVPDHKDGFWSAYMSDWGVQREEAGYHKDASFAQLEPKSANEVPKEIRDLIDRSQKQALKREALLRAEIARLSGG